MPDGHSAVLHPHAQRFTRGPKVHQSPPPARRHAAGRLQRTNTSSYTTAEAASSEDMQCTICLSILKDAVALEPCGHSYCAVCLSNHFAALLSGGQPVRPEAWPAWAVMQCGACSLHADWRRESTAQGPAVARMLSGCPTGLPTPFAAAIPLNAPATPPFMQLACPLRCSPPERVVANTVVRALVAARPHTPCLLRDGSHGSLLSAVPESHSDESSSRETSDRLAACGFLPGSAAAAADSGRNGGSGCPSMPMWLQVWSCCSPQPWLALLPHSFQALGGDMALPGRLEGGGLVRVAGAVLGRLCGGPDRHSE